MPLPEDLTKDWPDDLKSDPSLKDVNDFQALAKSFIHTKSLVGASVRPPGPDATPEDRAAFVQRLQEKVPELVLLADGEDEAAKLGREVALQRLGVPKEAKEYAPPKDLEVPEDIVEALRERAAKRKWTKAQFADEVRDAAEALATATRAEKEAAAALRKELGAAFDERTAAAAAIAAKKGAPEALVASLKAGTADPAVFRMFWDFAKGFGEKPHVADQGDGGGGGKLTPAEAKARRAELMARPEYFQPKPNQMDVHRSLVAKVHELNDLIDA